MADGRLQQAVGKEAGACYTRPFLAPGSLA